MIRPGNACRVELDGDTVLQGWVDTVTIDYDAGAHTIAVGGRDATGDLVDCSAASKPGEWQNERLENIAAALCEPFGISVSREIDTGAPFSQVPNRGRRKRIRGHRTRVPVPSGSPACQTGAVVWFWGGLIAAPQPSGWSAARTSCRPAARRHGWRGSAITRCLASRRAAPPAATFSVETSGITAEQVAHVSATARDGGGDTLPAADDHRRAITGRGPKHLARIQWEANVRSARARSVRVTVQGWREAPGGALWEPGRIVFLADEWLGIAQELLVSSTSQSLSADGTLTTLDLVPQDAFVQRAEPEPSLAAALGTNWWQ